jgi:hypothetical protein
MRISTGGRITVKQARNGGTKFMWDLIGIGCMID